MILWTSSWTSRIVKAELARQAFNAAKASVSRSFLSSSSPSLFLTRTSLIKTRSSSYRLSECAGPFSCWVDDSVWVDEDSGAGWLRDSDVEHRSGEFATDSDWVTDKDAEQSSGSMSLFPPSKSAAAEWSFWVNDTEQFDSVERNLSESSIWESEFLVLLSVWERRGREEWGRKRGTLRGHEVKRTPSFLWDIARIDWNCIVWT